MAAEGEFDEANTVFIGEHLHSLPATHSACGLWQLPKSSAIIASGHRATWSTGCMPASAGP